MARRSRCILRCAFQLIVELQRQRSRVTCRGRPADATNFECFAPQIMCGSLVLLQVIKEFCGTIGADAKQAQAVIRLAKKNGEWLGFLA